MEDKQGIPPGITSEEQLTPSPTEASQTVEKTEEQKKVEAIFNRVNEINQQLDGEVAHQISTKDGSTTLLFSRVADARVPLGDDDRGIAFGVNSVEGPIWFTLEVNKQFVGWGGITQVPEDLQKGEASLDTSSLIPVGKDMLEPWEEAFARSKNVVLNNQRRMEEIRGERNANLDKALDVVSQPVNLDAPPPRA